MSTDQKRTQLLKKGLIVFTVVLSMAFVCAIAGCQPKEATESDVTSPANNGIEVVGDFQNPGSGDFTDSYFNETFVNDAARGCNACHDDLWDVMSDISPIQHVMSSPAGYGQKYGITDCLTCHYCNLPYGGPRLGDIIHSAHYSNPQFTDDQNGTCWSCHATTVAGDIVLYDVYKYSDEFGGYPNSANPVLQDWLDLRTWRNNSVVDVVSDPKPAIEVEISQPISDEADMFKACNYVLPDLTADNYTLTITGVNNPRTFTLDELKEFPQVEIIATQDCMTNAVNGTMIGNFPIKGVLLKDVIDACGGVVEGNTTMERHAADGWFKLLNADLLFDQNAMLAFEYWGHELTPEQGYPVAMVVPGICGAEWVKYITEIDFNDKKSADDMWPMFRAVPDGLQGFLSAGWFSPDTDGQEFKVGEPITIDGYTYLNASSGHELTDVAFSADYGNHWTKIPIPEDFDQNQWVRWTGTFTPDKPGTYVLHTKAVDLLGDEQYMPASVIIKVVE